MAPCPGPTRAPPRPSAHKRGRTVGEQTTPRDLLRSLVRSLLPEPASDAAIADVVTIPTGSGVLYSTGDVPHWVNSSGGDWPLLLQLDLQRRQLAAQQQTLEGEAGRNKRRDETPGQAARRTGPADAGSGSSAGREGRQPGTGRRHHRRHPWRPDRGHKRPPKEP